MSNNYPESEVEIERHFKLWQLNVVRGLNAKAVKIIDECYLRGADWKETTRLLEPLISDDYCDYQHINPEYQLAHIGFRHGYMHGIGL